WRLQLALGTLTAKNVQARLATERFDVLFSAYSIHALHGVRPPSDIVTVFTTDATPSTYRESLVGASFGSYFRASRFIDPLIKRAEIATLERADLWLWPSDWLRTKVRDVLGLADDARSLTVPWGANVEWLDAPEHYGTLSPDEPVRLLLVGRDWYAKGGPLTYATFRALRNLGIDTRLDVVGCRPEGIEGDGVTVHGLLDRRDPEQNERLISLYRDSHFLVMPSMESYGFAFCEASAFGLPSLCYRVGGVPIREGINGHAVPYPSTPEAFVQHILAYCRSPRQYDALRRSTRREYEEHLNWDAWGRRTDELIREVLARRGARSSHEHAGRATADSGT
ncbi:MAG: glycosyltransferase family 4 protein, partial [Myxococcales bacterium]|nr:glycosyltransferase family 4 protein [Myxococcales bacterium]